MSRKKKLDFPLTAIRGHHGSLLLRWGPYSSWFYIGSRTLTGLRDRHGQCRCLTAPQVAHLLGIKGELAEPYDYVIFDSDTLGIFAQVSALDVRAAIEADKCRTLPTLPPGLLRKLC